VRHLLEGGLERIAPEASRPDESLLQRYEKIVARCRRTKGPCFCGVHVTLVAGKR